MDNVACWFNHNPVRCFNNLRESYPLPFAQTNKAWAHPPFDFCSSSEYSKQQTFKHSISLNAFLRVTGPLQRNCMTNLLVTGFTLPAYCPPLGFLNPSTVYASPYFAALFHAAFAPGVYPLQGFFLCRSLSHVSVLYMPSCHSRPIFV